MSLSAWKVQNFTLKVSAGLPQSETDKKIFYPNWELRPEFKWSKSRIDGYFESKKWYKFTNRNNPAEKYDEVHLAWERGMYFEEIGERRKGQPRTYRRRSHPVGNISIPLL
jgi:hypothetical protein